MNNPHAASRIELATELSALYAANPKVAVVYIAGSVARGWADEHSDIELNVFWHEAPDDEDRKRVIREAGGELVRFFDYEDSEWSEVYNFRGVKMEMSHFLLSTIEGYVQDVVGNGDVDLDKQVLIASVQDGCPLHGKECLQELKARSVYSETLGRAMVASHQHFEDAWYYAPLAERDDAVMLYDVKTKVIHRLLCVLCGLNSVYVSHPRFKWIERTAAQFEHAPQNLVPRLLAVYRSDSRTGLAELQQLVQDVRALIRERM